jgi:glycosyltransferase involved in cell wall biosynthesis
MPGDVAVSVVMCTYNRAHVLPQVLDALMRQDTGGAFTYDIVVVNDRSTDGTADIIAAAQQDSPVTIHHVLAEGEGVAAARNRGWQAARGEWIAYTDDDQVNEPTWLAALYDAARRSGAPCIGGSVHLRFDVPPKFPLTWVTKSMLGYKEHPEKEITRLWDCPGTGNVMFHRSVFEKLGGFDNGLHWGGEDAEFMTRLVDAGLRVWFTPRSVVHHLIPAYRVQEGYFKWCSLRVGVAIAEVDVRTRGKARLAILCCARIAQALLKNLPLLLLARLRGDEGMVLEKRCLLWRCGTYVRATLYLIAPALFPQRGFFDSLSFRGERSGVAKAAAATSGEG